MGSSVLGTLRRYWWVLLVFLAVLLIVAQLDIGRKLLRKRQSPRAR